MFTFYLANSNFWLSFEKEYNGNNMNRIMIFMISNSRTISFDSILIYLVTTGTGTSRPDWLEGR